RVRSVSTSFPARRCRRGAGVLRTRAIHYEMPHSSGHGASPGSNMLTIGLTGGIASGKSTVAELFAALGVPVIDTDVIAREVVEPGEPGLAAIRDAFGAEVLTPDGRLDRRRLREIVFADAAKRRRLESILHPLIRERTLARLAAVRNAPYAIVVVPLLVETDFGKLVDRVLVVDVPVDAQLERLASRDGIDRAAAEAMVAAQASRETRLAH